MLRRRWSHGAGACIGGDGDAAAAPLLDDDDDAGRGSRRGSGARACPPGGSPGVAAKAGRWVWGVLYAVADLLPSALHPVADLSQAELRRLGPFREHCARAYDEAAPAHIAALRELWAAFAPSNAPPEGLIGEDWKQYGFQGTNPATDFRGGGVLSLRNLLYFHRSYPAEFARTLRPTSGAPLPFAIAGINVTLMLLHIGRLTASRSCFDGSSSTAHTAAAKLARRSLATMLLGAEQEWGAGRSGDLPDLRAAAERDLSGMERVFGEVYCAAFVLLERLWRESGASIMEFNSVLLRTKTQMDEILRAAEGSVAAVTAAVDAGGR